MSISSANSKNVILRVEGLKKYFPIEKGFLRQIVGHVHAVDNISFEIGEGETLSLVGESGSGKTTAGRCVLRAIEPTAGTVEFRNDAGEMVDLTKLDRARLREMRRRASMIFQDPFGSLDPRWTVLDIVAEPLRLAGRTPRREIEDRVAELLRIVGLDARYMRRYPQAFSGGQRQRIGIARALATNPKLIIADEPVSALDVSIQAQILNLLRDLKDRLGLAYLFIAHDLSVVEFISDRVAVMYVGRIVELASKDELFTNPKHPYTEALLSAVPKLDPERRRERIMLRGEIANPAAPPSGCHFHPRCRYAQDICKQKVPPWEEIKPEHFVACHFAKELELQGAQPENAPTASA